MFVMTYTASSNSEEYTKYVITFICWTNNGVGLAVET